MTPLPSLGLLEGERPVLRGWEDEDGASIVGFNCPLPPICGPISRAALCSLGLALPGKGRRDVAEAGMLVRVQSPTRGFTHLVSRAAEQTAPWDVDPE